MTKLLTLSLLAAACGSSLPVASHIERERVLAAQVSVDSEPQRAWPRPGESATVRWITAAPVGTADLRWTLSACIAATSSGEPLCIAAPFATASGTGTPMLQFTTPDNLASDVVAVFGTVDDGSRSEQVVRHVFIAGDQANYNPSLVDADPTVDGVAWADSGCIEAGDERVVLGATLDDGDREQFIATDGTQSREHLELSVFATAGELLQPKAFVDPDDARERASVGVEWMPPEADEDISSVTFTFVVSDLRGGIDATTRSLCVAR